MQVSVFVPDFKPSLKFVRTDLYIVEHKLMYIHDCLQGLPAVWHSVIIALQVTNTLAYISTATLRKERKKVLSLFQRFD